MVAGILRVAQRDCQTYAFPSNHGFAYTSQMSIVHVANFESGDLSGWTEEQFRGKTNYMIVRNDGRNALIATSSASASGLSKDIRIDLKKTPYLNWSWKTENILTGLNEFTKAGDDYCARVYVIFKQGIFFWRTQSLTYVWSSNQPVGTSWPNAYTGNAMTVAVQSGRSWRSRRRTAFAPWC